MVENTTNTAIILYSCMHDEMKSPWKADVIDSAKCTELEKGWTIYKSEINK